MPNETTAAGPTCEIVVEEPTNSPAPMIPPSVIMVTWRFSRLLPNSGVFPAAATSTSA